MRSLALGVVELALLQAQLSVAIDLPMKMLIWKDKTGKVCIG